MSKIIPNLRVFFTLFFLSIAILILDFFNLLNLPKRAAFYISSPISFGVYNTYKNIGKQFYFLFLARRAGQENKALKEQTGKLLSENAELRKKLSETEVLLSQGKKMDPRTFNLLPTRPIGLGRYLKIDKGSFSAIKVDQVVVFEDNFIGKVVSVAPGSSNIQLLTDPDSKIAAFSQNKEGKAKGVLLGQFGTELLFDKILHEEKIREGDLVYSEGLEGLLPRGLILGKVTHVIEQQNEIFKQAKVAPIFGVGDLDLVFVILE